MIAVDSSAMVAIAFAEPERERFMARLRQAERVLISTVSVLETRMVVQSRKGERGVLLVDEVLRLPVFTLVPPDIADIETAYRAFVLYGTGSGHPAGLNFGDIFSYALAKNRGLPLLYKGEDFRHTDLVAAD